MIKFKAKLRMMMDDQGKTWLDMKNKCGVDRTTVCRGVKSRHTLAAIAYFMEMSVEELIEGTEMVDVWYG
jgi:hypothetical protein